MPTIAFSLIPEQSGRYVWVAYFDPAPPGWRAFGAGDSREAAAGALALAFQQHQKDRRDASQEGGRSAAREEVPA